MKIAISTLSGAGYGGATYFKGLIPALANIDKENEYHFFIDGKSFLSGIVDQKNFIFHKCDVRFGSKIWRLFWEQFTFIKLLKSLNIDIVFTAKNVNLLFSPGKTIISIRNMEPFYYKTYKNNFILNLNSWLLYWLSTRSIKKANKIIAVSGFVKDYIKGKFNVPEHKIEIVYNGNPVSTAPKVKNIEENKQPFLLSASKFVAYANQLTLIEGYALLNKEMVGVPDLWLAGGVHDREYYLKVRQCVKHRNLDNKIKFLGLVPHNELLRLYAQALVFIFPSALEACPQTLIEAMASGVPVLSSNAKPMPEIGVDAVMYFDTFNKYDMADKLKILLDNGGLRGKFIQAGILRAKYFSWERTAAELVRVFQMVHKK